MANLHLRRPPTYTRIRDVEQGSDGALYVLTDRDGGRIVRLVPENK
jgi:glucose/arabinose dehydrogenase